MCVCVCVCVCMCVCMNACMILCQKVPCEDPLRFGCKYLFCVIFSLNKLNFIPKCMHQSSNKNKNMKRYTKSMTEISGGMVDTSGVHCLTLISLCIFLL